MIKIGIMLALACLCSLAQAATIEDIWFPGGTIITGASSIVPWVRICNEEDRDATLYIEASLPNKHGGLWKFDILSNQSKDVMPYAIQFLSSMPPGQYDVSIVLYDASQHMIDKKHIMITYRKE